MIIWCVAVESAGTGSSAPAQTGRSASTRVDQLLKTLSDTLGLPWRTVEEFDSDALVQAVERVIIKPDGVDVVMKYRQVANA
jgi:hypothetical protein